jgi:hypothetical protein
MLSVDAYIETDMGLRFAGSYFWLNTGSGEDELPGGRRRLRTIADYDEWQPEHDKLMHGRKHEIGNARHRAHYAMENPPCDCHLCDKLSPFPRY